MPELKPLASALHDGDVHHYWRDDGNGGGEVVSQQDVVPIIEKNKKMQTHTDGWTASRVFRRAAHIPDIVALKWLNEEGWWIHDPNARNKLRQKLNDPDWRYLRTSEWAF